jgi:hypothetical protein
MGNAHERFDRQGLSRAAGFAGAFKRMRLSLAQARHLLSAFGTTRIRQLRSVMSSFEGFWLPTLMSAFGS